MKSFKPKFTITNKTAAALIRIEAVRERMAHLPIHPTLLVSLRESAKFYSTHYSTMIEHTITTWVEPKRTFQHE